MNDEFGFITFHIVDVFSVLFGEVFDTTGEHLVADEKFGVAVAHITASRRVAGYSSIETEDAGVLGVLTETLQEDTGRLAGETSSGENGGSNGGKHRRVVETL